MKVFKGRRHSSPRTPREFVGCGSPHLLPAATTLRVRLVASLEDRIRAVSRLRGVDRAEAARFVETTERERNSFLEDHFRIDATDPHEYDLVLNSSRYSHKQCAELIVEALHRLEAHAARPA